MEFDGGKYLKAPRGQKASAALINKIFEYSEKINKPSIDLMEVCGTHTHEIFRSGIRPLLPEKVRLRSGPGCPVCVTPDSYINGAIALARRKDVIVATFGDMLRVPGASSSLKAEMSAGADVRTVYSPSEAAAIALENPLKSVVLLAVGFETTAPAIAFLVKEAAMKGVANLFIYEGNKTVPAAISAITSHPDVRVDGFILPGHVSVITGAGVYEKPLHDTGLCGVVAGFEYSDILICIARLLEMISRGARGAANEYQRAVSAAGNAAALKLVREVFEECDCQWRGLGVIKGSGLRLRSNYSGFSASAAFADTIGAAEAETAETVNGCICGRVLLSAASPVDCTLFGAACTPSRPVGPCMVSSEGTCSAYYEYGRSLVKIEL